MWTLIAGCWLLLTLGALALIVRTQPRWYVISLIRDSLLYATFTAVAALPLLMIRR